MINSLIGKYRIVRLIGEGGMANVYEAEHEMLETKVAIKVLNPILSANNQIRDRFKNEAKLMASLNHPHITKVIDFDDQPHQLSIIMELLDGEDLNQKIKRTGALSPKEVIDIFSQTLSAFQYAHEKGIVHRDIKPSNIFILPDGYVKILDFGIAKLFGQGNEMTQTGTQIGTPVYMSPEQVKADKSIDFRSDIYSLGVTMYYAVNGTPPYNAETSSQFDIFTKIVYEALPTLPVHSSFNEQISKACAKDREERYQSCAAWRNDLLETNKSLNDHLGEIAPITMPSTTTDELPPWDMPEASTDNKSKTKLYIISILLLLITAGCLYLYMGKKDNEGIYTINLNVGGNVVLRRVVINSVSTVLKFENNTTDTTSGKITIRKSAYILDKTAGDKLEIQSIDGIDFSPEYKYTPEFELTFPRVSPTCDVIDFIEDAADSSRFVWKLTDINLTEANRE